MENVGLNPLLHVAILVVFHENSFCDGLWQMVWTDASALAYVVCVFSRFASSAK